MGTACSQNERRYKCFEKTLTGKPTEKRSLGKPRHRWEYNIIMDLK